MTRVDLDWLFLRCHLTGDRWQVTGDMLWVSELTSIKVPWTHWHIVQCDMWHVMSWPWLTFMLTYDRYHDMSEWGDSGHVAWMSWPWLTLCCHVTHDMLTSHDMSEWVGMCQGGIVQMCNVHVACHVMTGHRLILVDFYVDVWHMPYDMRHVTWHKCVDMCVCVCVCVCVCITVHQAWHSELAVL